MRIILILLLVCISLVFINSNVVNIALAQDSPDNDTSVSGLMNTAAKSANYKIDNKERLTPYYLVGNIIRVFIILLGIFFMGLMVYGGFMWMNAKGNDEQVKKAQGIIRDAIIGLLIAVGAYAITYFVLYNIGPQFLEDGGGFGPSS